MSKREEEERQRKINSLNDRDGQLIDQGIDKSKTYQEHEKKVGQCEDDLMMQAMKLSEAESSLK